MHRNLFDTLRERKKGKKNHNSKYYEPISTVQHQFYLVSDDHFFE